MSGTGLTDYSSKQLLLNVYGLTVSSATWPTAFYLGVSTTVPVFAKGSAAPYWNFTEPTDTAYARQAVTLAAAASQPSDAYAMSPNAAATFPTATVNWGSVLYAGLFDALTGGNLWEVCPLTRSTADGVTTSGSTTLTSATIAFTSADVGQLVFCPGVPLGTTIASVTNGTTAVMTGEAYATGSSLALAVATPVSVTSSNALSFPSATALFELR